MNYTFFRNTTLLFLVWVAGASTTVLAQNGNAQTKQMTCLSASGLFIDSGFAGEIRADVPVKRFLFTGAIGSRIGLGEDSVFVPPYASIQRMCDRGKFYKIGIGFKVGYDENSVNPTYKRYTFEQYKKYFGTDQGYYRSKSQNLNGTCSSYLMLEISYQANGQFIEIENEQGDITSLFVHGYHTFFAPKYRFMQQENYVNDKEKIVKIFDLGLPVTTDFKQIGLYGEFFYLKSPINVAVGLGFIRRLDKPEGFNNRFYTEEIATNYSWYVPIRCTIGFSILTNKN